MPNKTKVVVIGVVALSACIAVYHLATVQQGNYLHTEDVEKRDVQRQNVVAQFRTLGDVSHCPRCSCGDPDMKLVPTDNDLEKMSDKDVELFYHSYVLNPQILCWNIRRMGAILDGGWDMCLIEPYTPIPGKCLVYSFGIANDFTFDDDLDAYGCEVHAFDPSMYDVKDHKRNDKVYFHKLGLGKKDEEISKDNHRWNMKTLLSIRNQLGHEPHKRKVDMMKMDIECFETDTLPQALKDGSMVDVSQLAFEVHAGQTRARYLLLLRLLRDLYDNHFRIFLTHINTSSGNHFNKHGRRLSTCYEIHMVNTKARSLAQRGE